MANYGFTTTPSRIAFTGFTNTLGTADAVSAATAGYVYSNGVTNDDRPIARVMRRPGGNAAAKQLIYTLLGAATGSTATKTQARVQGTQGGNLTGVVPIETASLVNRATTSADLTAAQALFNRSPYPATYVADSSGNGGGGKIGSNGAIY